MSDISKEFFVRASESEMVAIAYDAAKIIALIEIRESVEDLSEIIKGQSNAVEGVLDSLNNIFCTIDEIGKGIKIMGEKTDQGIVPSAEEIRQETVGRLVSAISNLESKINDIDARLRHLEHKD